MADISFFVPEQTTQKLTFTLKDENGTPIPGVNLNSCTLTLYEQGTLAIVNNRDHVDIKANVDANGVLTQTFVPLDTALLAVTATGLETHVALFIWTYNASTSRGQYEVALVIRDSQKI